MVVLVPSAAAEPAAATPEPAATQPASTAAAAQPTAPKPAAQSIAAAAQPTAVAAPTAAAAAGAAVLQYAYALRPLFSGRWQHTVLLRGRHAEAHELQRRQRRLHFGRGGVAGVGHGKRMVHEQHYFDGVARVC